MADTNTANISLLIADLNDTFNFGAHTEANFTTIDGLMGAVQCTSGTRPTNTFAGQIIYETDSKRYAQNTGTKASPVWTYMSHQAIAAASSARPSVGLTAGELLYETDNGLVRPRGASAWLSNLPVCTSSARPASPVAGDLAVESDTNHLIQWTGSSWMQKAFANYVCTSSTHPAVPFTGLEIFETDTGLGAVYNGSGYSYGVQQIAPTQTLGATTATVTFSGIPAVNSLLLRWDARASDAVTVEALYLQFNGDTGNNYLWEINQANNAAAVSGATGGAAVGHIQIGSIPAASATANYYGSGAATIAGAGQASHAASVVGTGIAFTSVTNGYAGVYGGLHGSLGAITSLTIFGSSGSLIAGSQFTLYGMV